MAQSEDEDVLLQKVIEAAKGGKGRSRLYRYMRANYASLVEALDRPDWEAVAAQFKEAGYGKGGELAPATVRKMWWKVKRDVAAGGAVKAPSPAEPPPPPPVAPRPRSGRAPTAAPETDAEAALARMQAEMQERSGRK